MGMFKDIKKLKDQGKEIGAQTGRPTSMLGMLKDTPNRSTRPPPRSTTPWRCRPRCRSSSSSGHRCRRPGDDQNFTDTGTLVNFNPQVVLDLQVAVDGQTPYDAQLSTAVPQIYLSRLQAGGSIGVRVDPGDPSSIAIDWAQA